MTKQNRDKKLTTIADRLVDDAYRIPELHVFDFDGTLAHKPKGAHNDAAEHLALPTVDILKDKIWQQNDCYILTAREGDYNRDLIYDFLKMCGIHISKNNIIVWGEQGKGHALIQLINHHQPQEAYFYDDHPKNINHVKQNCANKTNNTNLHIHKYNNDPSMQIGELEYKEKYKNGALVESSKGGSSLQERAIKKQSRAVARRLRRMAGLI